MFYSRLTVVYIMLVDVCLCYPFACFIWSLELDLFKEKNITLLYYHYVLYTIEYIHVFC